MNKRKLSKRGMRRRMIVMVIEVAIVFAAMLCAIYFFGWLVSAATDSFIEAVDSAAKSVIG